jgi:hypothetical protein
MVDNPRGILSMGDQVFVLHTTFSKETGKATGMDLVVFEDQDNDGVADGPSKPLIQGISAPAFLQSRALIMPRTVYEWASMDGYILQSVILVFHDAVDRSGKKLTMHGGGIVRVRPNGKEMEVYTHGMRNIYDVRLIPT